MSIPNNIIALIDFSIDENTGTSRWWKLNSLVALSNPPYFGLTPDKLMEDVNALVVRELNRKQAFEFEDTTVWWSMCFSPLCQHVFEPFITALIMGCVYPNNKRERWLPTKLCTTRVNHEKGSYYTEAEYAERIYRDSHTFRNPKDVVRSPRKLRVLKNIFEMAVTYVVDSFILQWRNATDINATMMTSEQDLIETLEVMLIQDNVPPETASWVREELQVCLDNWETRYRAKRRKELKEKSERCRNTIFESKRANDEEKERMLELNEEIARMQDKLQCWEADHANKVSKVECETKKLNDLETEGSLYLLGGVCREMREFVIRETTNFDGFNLGAIFDVVNIISRKIKI